MAMKIKEHGYTRDCGYNQLLYPSEAQTRTLLAWLVQKLPRIEEDRGEETLGTHALLNRKMMEKLQMWKTSPWKLPFCCNGQPAKNIYHKKDFQTLGNMSSISSTKEMFDECRNASIFVEPTVLERHALDLIKDSIYASRLQGDVDDDKKRLAMLQGLVRNAISLAKQADSSSSSSSSSQSLQSLITTVNSDGSATKKKLERGGRFAHATEFEQEQTLSVKGTSAHLTINKTGESEEEIALKLAQQQEEERVREEELEMLRKEVADGQAALAAQERVFSNSSSKIRQLESDLAALLSVGERLEQDVLVKKKTLEMLPMAAENIIKLQDICGNNSKHLMKLAQEWESHRKPLLEQLRIKTNTRGKRRERCKDMVEEMKRCREEMVGMIQSLKDKQERIQVYNEEIKSIPKNINRAVYTHRIMDIIASINKQNADISKITDDIRVIQKTISATTSSMQRADAVAEELVFAAANQPKSDSATVETYRRLRTMRSKFEGLIDTVGHIGSQEKQSRLLETKIDREMTRVSANNFERIRSDLDQVLQDNAQIIAQIKRVTK